MRTAIIGAGNIAEKAYFPLLSAWQNLEIAGFYSYSEGTVADVSKRWGFMNGTTDLDKILALEPEAVFVISRTDSHYDICRYFMENSVDVYCEKSLTTSSSQSFELAEIAKKHNRVLAVGFNRRYAPLCEQAKEIWGNRPIESIIVQKHRTRDTHKTALSYFLDDAIHQIDLLRYFCGDLKPVSCFRENHDNGDYSGALAVMEIPGSGHAVFSTVTTAGAWQEMVTIHGSGMSLHLDMFRKLTIKEKDHEIIYGRDRAGSWISGMKERGFEGEIAHFLNCCKTRESPRTNAAEAAKTQQLMENLVRMTGEDF
jgi:virulence factor